MIEELIGEYLKRSVVRELEGLDFDTFFKEFMGMLHRKLALHGVLTFEDYLSQIGAYYDTSVLEQFAYIGQHSRIKVSPEDVKRTVFISRYLTFNAMNKGSDIYVKLMELFNELEKALPYLDAMRDFDKIDLFEKCIHASHGSGFVVGFDVDSLREYVERLVYDRNFGMLTRAGLDEKVKFMRKPFNALLIDLTDIRGKNREFGYGKVNEMVRHVFRPIGDMEIAAIGRYFSGDEIVILSYAPNLYEIVRRCQARGEEVGLTMMAWYSSDRFDIETLGEIKH